MNPGDKALCDPAPEECAARIVAHLLKIQQRGIQQDTGHGITSAREVGMAVGLKPKAARALLTEMAERGEVRRFDAINGLFWQSVNLLPWEPGGKWPGQAERELRELKAKAADLTAELQQITAAIGVATEGLMPTEPNTSENPHDH